MIIAIQLMLFLSVFIFRGRGLVGGHLEHNGDAGYLSYIGKGKHGAILSREYGLAQSGAVPFVVRKERFYHRFLKAMGIASEMSFQDEAFDDKYFFTTDYPEHIEQAIHSKELLKHLKALFALPVKSLHATPSKIWCRIDKADLKEPESYFQQHIEILRNISSIITARRFGEETLSNYKQYLAFGIISFHAALLTIGVSLLFISFDTIDTFGWQELEYRALIVGGGFIAVWAVFIMILFGQSSWVCWVLADLMLCGVVGILLTSTYLAREGNIHLAQGPTQIMHQPIVLKKCTLHCSKSCGKRCTTTRNYDFTTEAQCSPAARPGIMETYRREDSICASSANYIYTLSVNHWSEQGQYVFKTDPALFDTVKAGDVLAIPLHPGAFNTPWVDSETISKR